MRIRRLVGTTLAVAVLSAALVADAGAGPRMASARHVETVPVPGSGLRVPRWPYRYAGWTVIVASKRTASDAARSAGSWADAAALRCGVLRSSEHASLRPGYWVAWCGRSKRKSDAEADLWYMKDFAGGNAGGAYVRFVSTRRG